MCQGVAIVQSTYSLPEDRFVEVGISQASESDLRVLRLKVVRWAMAMTPRGAPPFPERARLLSAEDLASAAATAR